MTFGIHHGRRGSNAPIKLPLSLVILILIFLGFYFLR